jgi:repressor LexA
MQPQLTPKQQRFLDYLQREIARTGQCPSLRQAAADQGVSHAAIAQFFRVLEEKGYLKREGRYSRKVYLLNRAREAAALQRWCEIPIIGRVTAGLPMYAQTEWDGSIVLDAAVYRSQNLFALRVKGDSMNAAGILSINSEEATVKRFFLRDDHIELRPENADYSPMRYGFGEVLVQGKIIGIHRGPEGIK